MMDGGYDNGEAPVFHPAPQLVRILKQHKLLNDDANAPAQLELDALGATTAQAMHAGTREKQGPALSLVQEDEVETPNGKLVANIDGFNLYASPIIDGKDRETLKRTARICCAHPLRWARFACGLMGSSPTG